MESTAQNNQLGLAGGNDGESKGYSASHNQLAPSQGPFSSTKSAGSKMTRARKSKATPKPGIRERVIHSLAVQPLSKSDLRSRLSKEGISSSEQVTLITYLPVISTFEDKLHHLKGHVWKEVDENWQYYTEEEREKVKLRKCANIASLLARPNETAAVNESDRNEMLNQSPSAGGNESHTVENSSKRLREDLPIQEAKKRKLSDSDKSSHTQKYFVRPKCQNTIPRSCVSTESLQQEPNQQHNNNTESTAGNKANMNGFPYRHNIVTSVEMTTFHEQRKHTALSLMNPKLPSQTRDSGISLTSSDPEKHSSLTAKARYTEENGVGNRFEHPNAPKATVGVQQEQPQPYQPPKEKEVAEFLRSLMSRNIGYQKTEDLTAYEILSRRNPKYAYKLPVLNAGEYPPIREDWQRLSYRSKFKSIEGEYKSLHSEIQVLTSNFWRLRNRFMTTQQHSSEFKGIAERFHACCLRIIGDEGLIKRARLDYLHELRKHLFLRVADSENPTLADCARQQVHRIQEELRMNICRTPFMIFDARAWLTFSAAAASYQRCLCLLAVQTNNFKFL
ncbi:unnamed protein product [Ceratitis capitata]|uniref:(Mediterranean fruit fly) hypothetical protein n=1 Tax=Ceratitis capitata TaxID=7213 RepID=A0A811UBM5_CERCA|nr:unnamed protein product [Ceratitis capitata]